LSDILETSPLGRAEWIKFFGAFLGKQNLADSIFSVVESNYKRLSQITQSVSYRPKVFLNLPFKDIWYFPGSENYFAQFINDAGGNYVFPELQGSRSHPVSTEVAYRAGLECDVWLNPGTAISLSDITDPILRFAVLRHSTGMVYIQLLKDCRVVVSISGSRAFASRFFTSRLIKTFINLASERFFNLTNPGDVKTKTLLTT
jgi:iron complex transport system substrate-binding protein